MLPIQTHTFYEKNILYCIFFYHIYKKIDFLYNLNQLTMQTPRLPTVILNLVVSFLSTPNEIGKKVNCNEVNDIVQEPLIGLLLFNYRLITHHYEWFLRKTVFRLQELYKKTLLRGLRMYIPYQETPQKGKKLVWEANKLHDKIIMKLREIFPNVYLFQKTKLTTIR